MIQNSKLLVQFIYLFINYFDHSLTEDLKIDMSYIYYAYALDSSISCTWQLNFCHVISGFFRKPIR